MQRIFSPYYKKYNEKQARRNRKCTEPVLYPSQIHTTIPKSSVDMYYFQPILLAKSNIAKQYFCHFFNVICDGSPSRIRRVRLISFGMTTRPRSSILLTIPVAFISEISLAFSSLANKLQDYCVFLLFLYTELFADEEIGKPIDGCNRIFFKFVKWFFTEKHPTGL